MNKGKENAAEELIQQVDIEKLERAIVEMSASEGEPHRKEGLLLIAVEEKLGHPKLAYRVVGDVKDRLPRFVTNVTEKYWRLSKRREKGGEDVTASQSANPEGMDPAASCTYGEAIYFLNSSKQPVYISFSGTLENISGALVFAIGHRLGLTWPSNYKNPLIRKAQLYLIEDV